MITKKYKGAIFSGTLKFSGVSNAIRMVEEKRDADFVFFNFKYMTEYPICMDEYGFWAIPVELTVGCNHYFDDSDYDVNFGDIEIFVGDCIKN